MSEMAFPKNVHFCSELIKTLADANQILSLANVLKNERSAV
jgi:hypothetical protein